MTPLPDNSDSRDYILELSSAPASDPEKQNEEERKSSYLSIFFRCCHVYAPIYRNRAGTAYSGHCPRCQRPATVRIGPTGSSSRIFQAE